MPRGLDPASSESPLAILSWLGLPLGEALRAKSEGIVHAAWLCGDFVVRILKDREEEEDCLTEMEAAPLAFAAGVLTPEPLFFGGEEGERWSVFRRSPGKNLAEVSDLPDPDAFFRHLGAELKKTHQKVKPPLGGLHHLDEAWDVQLQITPDQMANGLRWLLEEDPLWRRDAFVHQDLHPNNILVHEGKLSAILDWGDAGFGDPSADFRYIPPRHIPSALEGYGGADPALWHTILLHLADQILYQEESTVDYGPWSEWGWDDLSDLASIAPRR